MKSSLGNLNRLGADDFLSLSNQVFFMKGKPMLFSLALMFLIGLGLGKIFEKIKLPKLIGMILTGMILGPHALNLLDDKILLISSDLRQLALVIILIRAGLNLDIKDLKRVGRPALLLSFIPALFEIIGYMILGPLLLGLSLVDAALLGSVIAAVSPAVIVPKMLKLKEKGWGTRQLVPQLVMAGASMDDVFVIVLFTSLLSLSITGSITSLTWIQLPSSIIMGIIGGIVVGKLLSWWFTRFHIRDSGKFMIMVSVAFLLLALKQINLSYLAFSGLIAIMILGATFQIEKPEVARRLSIKFSKLWLASEVILFVLVGASVSLAHLSGVGLNSILLIGLSLMIRISGVLISLIKTNYSFKERIFIGLAYIPKATVQAAIGGIVLSLNHPLGQLILSTAVLSILIAAPLGAWLIDHYYSILLSQDLDKDKI